MILRCGAVLGDITAVSCESGGVNGRGDGQIWRPIMIKSLSPVIEPGRATRKCWHTLYAGAFAIVLIPVACLAQGGADVNDIHQGYHPQKDASEIVANQGPDIRRRLEMHTIRLQRQQFAAANIERKRQMSADTERLVQLVAELNAELEKADKADLSLVVKTETIEKLARAVKEKMKLTIAPP